MPPQRSADTDPSSNRTSNSVLLTEVVHGRKRHYQHVPNTLNLKWSWERDKSGMLLIERILPRRMASYLRTLFLPIGKSAHPFPLEKASLVFYDKAKVGVSPF